MDNKELKARVKEIKKLMKKVDRELIKKATDIEVTTNMNGTLLYSFITYQQGGVANGGIIVHVDTGDLTVTGIQNGVEYSEEITEDEAKKIDNNVWMLYVDNMIDRYRYNDYRH